MSFFSKKQKKQLTRLFFATDLHGSERTYRKFINAGKFYEANVLVMGGDITGKLLIPIIKESNGNYRATLQGTVQHLSTDAELQSLLDKIGLLGFWMWKAVNPAGSPHGGSCFRAARGWILGRPGGTRLNGTGISAVTGGRRRPEVWADPS
jgi:hypothetical protein